MYNVRPMDSSKTTGEKLYTYVNIWASGVKSMLLVHGGLYLTFEIQDRKLCMKGENRYCPFMRKQGAPFTFFSKQNSIPTCVFVQDKATIY